MSDAQSVLVDFGLWLYHGFFLPGDQLLSLLGTHAPGVAKFLALDAASHGGVVSGFISAVVWLGALILIAVIYEIVRDMDRALAALVVRLYQELRRLLRVVARRVTIALRSYALERQARLARTEVFEQPALTALQLEVLQFHTRLPPGHVLTPSYIARALDMHSTDIEQVLAALKKVSLVERTLGAGDGEDGYRLTRAGAVFLSACSAAQPVKGTASAPRTLRPKRIEPTLGSL